MKSVKPDEIIELKRIVGDSDMVVFKEEKKKEVKTEKPKIDLDVNKDGVVDKKDISIMAKELGKKGGRPKKKNKK